MPYVVTTIDGWMDGDALNWLYDQATQMDSIVEIGSWKGRSTHALLSGCRGPVFAVDHFKGNPDELEGAHKEATQRDIFEDFWRNVGMFRNLVALRMESSEAAKYFADKSVDMVFIDACHQQDAVLRDLRLWGPKCRKLLCGHDESYEAVRGALREYGGGFQSQNGGIWSINVTGT